MDERSLPRYRCHKTVSALKIRSLSGTRLSFEDEGYAPIDVPLEWITKHSPHAGGYLVVYEDGYRSFSPAAAFEQGYTRI